jgi:splicing factor 3B subunit 4
LQVAPPSTPLLDPPLLLPELPLDPPLLDPLDPPELPPDPEPELPPLLPPELLPELPLEPEPSPLPASPTVPVVPPQARTKPKSTSEKDFMAPILPPRALH